MSLEKLLTKLERARLKATQGAWTKQKLELHQGGNGYEVVDNNGESIMDDQTYYNTAPSEENAEYITLSANHILQLIKAARVMALGLKYSSGAAAADALRQADKICGGGE